MVKIKYIPEKGDIVWVNFDNEFGHEQKGRRPALVLSSSIYNSRSRLALVVPITSKTKSYPLEVTFSGNKIKGYILSDQIKSYDWHNRDFSYISRIDRISYDEVMKKVWSIIFDDSASIFID